MNSSDVKEKVYTLEDLGIEEGHGYILKLHNDDYTPIEYVVMVLMRCCNKSQHQACKIAMAANNNGSSTIDYFDCEEDAKKMKSAIDTENKRYGQYLLVTVEED